MNDSTTAKETSSHQHRTFLSDTPQPGILVASQPEGAASVDRCRLVVPFSVGRDRDSSLSLRDDKVSKHHFRIVQSHGSYWIEDIGSTNGTFVNGHRLSRRQCIQSDSVIRAGRVILVFSEDAEPMLRPPYANRYGMAGRFHITPVIEALQYASKSDRQILLAGPTGTGKELAANALASMMGEPGEPVPMLTFNAARFTSEDEIMSTLFGVTKRVFSGVEERPGLIEQASGGALFLDEIHNLPVRVQRSLLRIIEDGRFSRIGETQTHPAEMRFIFACNEPGPTYSLAHDLLARLRVVNIPSLAERKADIPTIFDAVLVCALDSKGLDAVSILPFVKTDHYESLCLDGFERDNVRGLMDLADRIATRMASHADAADAVVKAFSDRFSQSIVAKRQDKEAEDVDESLHYKKHKQRIIQAYDECRGNLSQTERHLRASGIMCTRRWLGIYLARWGVRK